MALDENRFHRPALLAARPAPVAERPPPAMAPKASSARAIPVKTDGTVKSARTKNAVLSRGYKIGLDQINTILKEQPHKIPHCLLLLQGDMLDMNGTSVQTAKQRQMNVNEPWPKTYTTVDMIPRFWLCAFLQKVAPDFSDIVLAAVVKADKSAVKKLITFACGLQDAAALPPACRNKLVCSMWFERLYEVHGRRLSQQWVSSFVSPQGAIDWLRGGVYLVAQDGSKPAFAIKHCELPTPVLLPLVLEPGTAVKDNYSDAAAEIDDGLGIKCINLFKGDGAKLLERDQKPWRQNLALSIEGGMTSAASQANASQVVVADGVMAMFKQAPPKAAKALAPPCPPALCDGGKKEEEDQGEDEEKEEAEEDEDEGEEEEEEHTTF